MKSRTFYSTVLAGSAALLLSAAAQATVVQVKTNVGDFEINLFDETTPATVGNFLSYVSSGRYDNTVMHRSVRGFVVQGGGYRFSGQLPLTSVSTNPAVVNEPKWSNVRGTVAMAKVGGNPNSATNQWFINLADNSSNLDLQNGGFTVFGHISTQGMAVADAMAALSFYGSTELPVRNYSAADYTANVPLQADNLVVIESITVVDSRSNTAASLSPKPNTLLNNATDDRGSSSGGSTGGLMLLASALLLGWRRKFR